jgi:hypothetical protein
MVPHDELSEVTAAELVGRIRRRELSPVEIMDAAIARIEADNERLNAFVHLDLDQARERADVLTASAVFERLRPCATATASPRRAERGVRRRPDGSLLRPPRRSAAAARHAASTRPVRHQGEPTGVRFIPRAMHFSAAVADKWPMRPLIGVTTFEPEPREPATRSL